MSAEMWLNQMEADDVVPELIKTHRIPYRADDIRMKQTRTDMFKILAANGRRLT